MKFHRFLLATVFLCASELVFAQVAADPLDYFYTDLVIWETAGLINNLPAARPYPLQIVKQILSVVIEKGDAEQQRLAQGHYQRFFNRQLSWGYKTELVTETEKGKRQMGVALALDANIEIEDIVSTSFSIDGWAINKLPATEVLPAGSTSEKDIVPDNAKIGPFWILPSMNSSFSVGTTEYYFNAGLMRGSFGPFHSNGVVVGPQALHAGQISCAVNKSTWGFNMSLYSLSASNGQGDLFSGKYLSVHSFDFHPFDWFSISILESVVYGGRLDLSYLFPVTPFLISQGVSGFNDNSYLGGMFTVKPIKGLKIDGVLYADDLSFNDIARLKFDTKWRLAGQAGVSYVPKKSGIFTIASVDYTMVTPYNYSHKHGDPINKTSPNYQNYLHYDSLYGAALQPNSDRLNIKLTLRPLEGIDFDIVGLLIRHGNVNEGLSFKWVKEYITRSDNIYTTDGTVHNASGTEGAGHAFNYSTPFLSQDTLEYIWQTGFNVLCRLPVLKTGGYMVFKLGYRFEYHTNKGINSDIYTYSDLGANPSDDVIQQEATRQLSAWKEKAKSRAYNNYISAGFQYFY